MKTVQLAWTKSAMKLQIRYEMVSESSTSLYVNFDNNGGSLPLPWIVQLPFFIKSGNMAIHYMCTAAFQREYMTLIYARYTCYTWVKNQ